METVLGYGIRQTAYALEPLRILRESKECFFVNKRKWTYNTPTSREWDNMERRVFKKAIKVVFSTEEEMDRNIEAARAAEKSFAGRLKEAQERVYGIRREQAAAVEAAMKGALA